MRLLALPSCFLCRNCWRAGLQNCPYCLSSCFMQEFSCLMLCRVSKRQAWGETYAHRLLFWASCCSSCPYWLLILSSVVRGSSACFLPLPCCFLTLPCKGLLLIVNYNLTFSPLMFGKAQQQTVTLTKAAHCEMTGRLQKLQSQNRGLQQANVRLSRENEQMMLKIEDVVSLQKTVKHLSKKVLEYSKCKVHLEKSRTPSPAPNEQLFRLQAEVDELRRQADQLKEQYEGKCRELQATGESRSKFQLIGAEAVSGFKKKIGQMQADYKTLQGRYRKIKDENAQLSVQNESIQNKYEKILEEFNELYQKFSG